MTPHQRYRGSENYCYTPSESVYSNSNLLKKAPSWRHPEELATKDQSQTDDKNDSFNKTPADPSSPAPQDDAAGALHKSNLDLLYTLSG